MDPRIFGREFSCFGGVTREREEEEKGVNESLYNVEDVDGSFIL
jgi:hypothetical protein